MAKTSSGLISNWIAMMKIGIRVTGMATSLQFIDDFFGESNMKVE
ncbi:hypothetical protein BD31_I0241 [Candidatus Nitrosopumilus salaria BD31]|jgi:hypothetical protein|uniref:Uncharacterized protein n=1 Tax=Candidatus Nitrosopumilus salarius BD31 TaxID=859350 RepID=I3D4X5_9ARCH|nr:hypothetical protein BD31_I0241 [Candidatus Nitrosopumilus salaria BD31]